ncbi:PRTRC system protein C [Fluviicola sp.]|uniref:PRTRC system protein C n=1 Tax=Fluviicola sp. TaxID=1917219 RepID=UPI0031E3E7F2
MLLAMQLERVFIIKSKDGELRLPDPNPGWEPETVKEFLANTYPELVTANVSAPKIVNDTYEIRFESVLGTKG